jgi:alkanesulfonate monooxygenase SsuD/methylene tetrahydromethanopterin reductase-like flavin-dependent oxidoreductase (luciferase family)
MQSPSARSSQEIYARGVEIAQTAEALGFRNVWLAEHHFSTYGYLSRPVQLATHIAAKTTRLRVGTAVIVVPLHHPLVIAEEIATLDLLSGGRLDVGLGRGYQHYEFERFGLELERDRERWDESVDVVAVGPVLSAWPALHPLWLRPRCRTARPLSVPAKDLPERQALAWLSGSSWIRPAAAIRFGRRLLGSRAVRVVRTDEILEAAALNVYERFDDPRLSLTDCVSFAIMRALTIPAPFAFDADFERAGFQRLRAGGL